MALLCYNADVKNVMRPRVTSTERVANIQVVKELNVSVKQPTLFSRSIQDQNTKKASKSGSQNPNWKGGLATRVCKICETTFQVKQKVVRKGGGLYCSRHCSRIGVGRTNTKLHAAKRIQKLCVICNAKITVKPSRAKIEGTYCSTECMSTGYAERLRGEANPNWRNLPADHQKQWARNWRQLHPDKTREWNRNTRARRMSAKGSHSEADIRRLLCIQRGECMGCKNKLRGIYHIDHIFPLVKGGTNYAGNLQLLCPQCNTSKKDKLWIQVRARLADPHLERAKLFEWCNAEIERLPQLQMMFEVLPDYDKHCLVVCLACPVGGYSGMFVELNASQSSHVRIHPKQKQRVEALTIRGYCARICYGADEAKAAIENYLGVTA